MEPMVAVYPFERNSCGADGGSLSFYGAHCGTWIIESVGLVSFEFGTVLLSDLDRLLFVWDSL